MASDAERKSKRDVVSRITISCDAAGVESSTLITQYDLSVHEAVISLFEAGRAQMTVRDVCRVMGANYKNPGKATIKATRESISKQLQTLIDIDRTAELRNRKITIDGEEVAEIKQKAQMLQGVLTTVKMSNGKCAECLELSSEPILWHLDKAFKQVTAWPQSLIEEMSKAVQPTHQSIIIRDYVIKRVQWAKNSQAKSIAASKGKRKNTCRPVKKKLNPQYKIAYATLMQDLNLDASHKNRIASTVRAFMAVLESQSEIAGWCEYQATEDAGKSSTMTGVAFDVIQTPFG